MTHVAPLTRPPALHPGDRIIVVAPSSPHDNRSEIERGAAFLRSWGYQVTVSQHVASKRGYLAGTDEERAADLNAAFADQTAQAIWCFRGGYGAARLLPLLDFAPLRQHPRIVIGFSDITALHLAIQQQAGLVTFYGPMVRNLHRSSPYTQECLKAALSHPHDLPRRIAPSPDDGWVQSLVPGSVTAPLVGGCLTLLAQSLGTPAEIDTAGKVLFFEDVNEEPYRIDGYLTQLAAAGKLRQVAGIVIGEMFRCTPRTYEPAFTSSLSLEDVLDDHIRPLGVPALYGLPLGHGHHLCTLPLGVMATLDATRGELWLTEAAVM